MAVSPATYPTDPEIEMALRSLPGWFWFPVHLAQYRCIKAAASLRAQLQQAQEELANTTSLLQQTAEAMEEFAAERDEAIERGKEAWRRYESLRRSNVYYQSQMRKQTERAEAAEGDAAEQRARVWELEAVIDALALPAEQGGKHTPDEAQARRGGER